MTTAEDRFDALTAWYRSLAPGHSSVPAMISGDASFRKFYRVAEGILMDAPPETEKNREFVALSRVYRARGIKVPEVYAADFARGFLFTEDLGSDMVSMHEDDPAERHELCRRALGLLVKMAGTAPEGLPPFDAAFMTREIGIGLEWFFGKALRSEFTPREEKAVARAVKIMIANNLRQPQVFMHRDFHCRNLMVCGGELALVDFQDTVGGPLFYDFASLVYDCYRDFTEEERDGLAAEFAAGLEAAGVLPAGTDLRKVKKAAGLTALQRLFKCAGIFCRLYLRDGKPGYLGSLPRVLGNIVHIASADPVLRPLAEIFRSRLPAARAFVAAAERGERPGSGDGSSPGAGARMRHGTH